MVLLLENLAHRLDLLSQLYNIPWPSGINLSYHSWISGLLPFLLMKDFSGPGDLCRSHKLVSMIAMTFGRFLTFETSNEGC